MGLAPAHLTTPGHRAVLVNRCPACREHFIVIPVAREGAGSAVPPVWTARGELEVLTVAPSIDAHTPPCRWHGWIVDGEVRPA